MAKKNRMPTPIEAAKEQEKKITFSDRWEEELKKKLFEEENTPKEELQTVEDYLLSKTTVHKKRPGEEWDVPLNEEIKYFDPELSYEITGYRPITMEQGLDFNPDLFRERAIIYNTTGSYTEYPQGRKPYNDFWDEEFNRCQNGLTIGKYRITGDHYFFLNYYRMQTIKEDAIAGSGRNESFPGFLSKQYEFFHYVEMAEKLGKDICLLKARGLGASEMLACLAVRPYTTNRGYNVMLTCAAESKLSPLREKTWKQLDWLNMNTNGGMRHVRLVINNNDTKRASIKTPDGIEYGWMSQITSIVGDTADKIRGSRLDRLIYDECFDPDTRIIMSDSSVKCIKDVKIGDYVLGIDGLPKEIVRICKGTDTMYEINQTSGITYKVNSKHPLYLMDKSKWPEKNIITIPVEEYVKKGIRFKSTTYGLCTSGINGTESCELNPYYLGLWLGDGYSEHPNRIIVNVDDIEIIDWVKDYFSNFVGEELVQVKDSDKTTILYLKSAKGRNPLINLFKKYNLFNNKHIPNCVLNSSLEYKLNVLAGLIDSDGFIKSKNRRGSSYEIEMSRKDLIFQISQLAQSCGFKTTISKRLRKKHLVDGKMIKNDSVEWAVLIKGNVNKIPVLLKRKQNVLERQFDSNISHITVKKLTKGDYIGITLKSYGDKFDNLFFLNDYTIVHNCGSNKNLTESWIKGDALVSLGGKHFGVRLAIGTGGDDFQLQGLATMFTNPEAYNILPFKNYDTDDGKPELSSFFIPAHKFALTSKYLDKRGVTNHIEFKKFYEAQRAKLSDKDYLNECAEHCFTPREALSKHGDNIFDAEVLAERIIQVKTKTNYTKPKRMQLLWDKTAGDGMSKVIAKESETGQLLVVEPPLIDSETGQPYKNLYVAGIDAIDMGKNDSATDNDVSDFCVVVKKRVLGTDDPKYVAMYKYRPNDIRQAYDLTMKLLTWYNCKAMLEYTKISIQTYFKEKKKGHLFMTRPDFASSSNKKGKRLIGLPATESVIKHGLELISNFINDYWHTIDFEEILDQMLNYTYENKRKFDIIAAMGQCEIGDEDMTGVTPTTVDSVASQWQDFGWYTDENGHKRRGIIPKDYNRWS